VTYLLKYKKSGRIVAFLAVTLLLSNVRSSDAAEPQKEFPPAAAQRTLVLGRVSDNPKKHYKRLKAMADYMVAHMRDLGIVEAKVLMAKDRQQMTSYLKQGKVDWVTETPFAAVIFREEAGAEVLLRRWKSGVSEYFTIFFARKDSGIRSFNGLTGKTIAFEDARSSSAYFVPASLLIDDGLKLTRLATAREKPPAAKVGYVFAGDPINITTLVYKRLIQAGAYSNLDWDDEDNLAKALRNELHIFYTSKRFPRAIELVRKDLAPRIKQRIKAVLLNIDKDPAAKSVLQGYEHTTKFDELDQEALSGLEEARRIAKTVLSELTTGEAD
jgi:phosphonate transport system substrate-binding protein